MIPDLNSIECLTLFVDDLPKAREFYQKIFSAKIVFEDPTCAVVGFKNLMVNLLKISEAPELITPAKVAGSQGGSRFMITIRVPNVDIVCAQLEQNGVKLLNGPMNRPWGRRTATFADPSGNAWEIAHEI